MISQNIFNKPNAYGKPSEGGSSGTQSFKLALDRKSINIMVAAIILILSVTIVRQTVLNVFSLQSENKSKEEKLIKLAEKSNYLSGINKDQLELEVRNVEQVFPSKKPALELINSLTILAGRDKVSLSELTLNPGRIESGTSDQTQAQRSEQSTADNKAPDPKLQKLNITFFVSGEFNDVNKFISDLELSSPIVQIDSLGILTKAGENDKKIIQVNMSVEAFYQPAPSQLPALDQAVIPLTSQENEVLAQLSIFNFYPLVIVPVSNTGQREDPFKRSL